MRNIKNNFCTLTIFLCLTAIPLCSFAGIRGIYVSQASLTNTSYIRFLIRNARAVGINTFVIDLNRVTRRYKRNISLVEANHIKYVARIVVFPKGGSQAQVLNKRYWQRRYNLARQAVALGARAIQLDYIRYHVGHKSSSQNARNIYRVIAYFKKQLNRYNVPLQIAVFGETSFGPSNRIGQNIRIFANTINSLSPMLYPSHYEPYVSHSRRPYKTVFDSISAIKRQFNGKPPFSVCPYIEMWNYRYPMSRAKKLIYINAQIRAVEDSNVAGWYAWSANNKYGLLFRILKNRR